MTSPSTPIAPPDGQPSGPLPADTEAAVQAALGAEHAAIWIYGLVSAFLPDAYDDAIAGGLDAHRARRDGTERLLAAAGKTPQPAEAAYLPPQPVSDEPSALAVVVLAETDVTVAWRAVLDRCDDAAVRTAALGALTESAVRATRWRKAAGQSPATPALPGQP